MLFVCIEMNPSNNSKTTLVLYRKILKVHRKVLPEHLRKLGNSYVRYVSKNY